ncbi:uncharacterized protein PAC_05625 [Phialocephala subalpina]|uniref:T6SS Phospholipase effector Tle1-like catalytic domain-containing protein n=1 Tax=Phialocephala subalpina TaxID=576137 RepID=A0A1L7WSJ0_9HELO|nr:uncharacterized protein PAC_05625 [Phialocephala subalpina]
MNPIASAPTRRRWIIPIDGTWADRSLNESTVMSDLASVLETANRQTVAYFKGVGTSASVVENLHGGLTGLGIDHQVLEAFGSLITNWNESDEIVLAGYSRGAYAATILADLISRVGIPQDNASAHDLLKKYKCGDLNTKNRCVRASKDFRCRATSIKALALFDTVGSLGMPQTGVFNFLTLFSHSKLVDDWVGPLRGVQNIFHALALHESRGPYVPSIIHLPVDSDCNLDQVWFAGSHHDLGKQDPSSGGLVDTPLSWMIAKLKGIGIEFNDAKLQDRFPCYLNPAIYQSMGAAGNTRDWATWRVHNTYKGFVKLMGYEPRRPGRYLYPTAKTCLSARYKIAGNVKTNESIHISVRDRIADPEQSMDVLPGLRFVGAAEGSGRWCNLGSWCSREEQINLPEASFNSFEALLQGFELPQ